MHAVHLETLDLNLLHLLDALLAERSVSRAAARVGLSQSAASHALRRLREHLDDPLLVRTAQGMALTERAQRMREPLRRALDDLAHALAPPPAFSPATEKRSFLVIAADYAQCVLLPPLLRTLAASAPDITLTILPFTDAIERELSERRADLALVVQYDPHPGLCVQAVLRERLLCVVRRDHPEVQDDLTLDAFLRLRHVRIAPRGRAGSVVDSALDAGGHTRRVSVSVPNFLSAPYLVARTDLVVTLAERLARQLAAWLPLRLFEPPLPLPGFTLSMLWDAQLDADPASRWLREQIRQVAKGV